MSAAQGSPGALVVAVGARSPAGATARLGLLGLRADAIDAATMELEEEVAVHTAMPLGAAAGVDARALALGAAALAEARLGEEGTPVPLLLAAPPACLASRSAGELVAELGRRAGVSLDRSASAVVGTAAGAFELAVRRGIELVGRAGGPSRVVVGAADSLLDPEVLAELYAARRLRPVGAPRQPAGALVPAEGAAFLVLAPEGDGSATAFARVSVAGAPALDAPGLSDAARGLLGLCGGAAELTLLGDANGEVIRGRPWTRLLVELSTKLGPDAPTITPWNVGEAIGDADRAGSAIGAALVAASMGVGLVAVPRVVVATLREGLVSGIALDPRGGVWSGALPPSPPPSRASREARIAVRVVEGLWSRFRAAQHRIAPGARRPLAAALSGLATSFAALESAVIEPGALAQVAALRTSVDDLTRGAEHARRSAERRGHAPEAVVVEAHALAAELALVVDAMRAALLEELARATEPLASASGPLPLPLSVGVPAVYPFAGERWRGGAAALATLDDPPIDEDEDDAEPGDGARPSAPDPEPAVASADPGAMVACLDEIGRALRVRTPSSDGAWSPALADVDERMLAALDRTYGASAPLAREPHPGGVLAGIAIDPLPLVLGAVDPSDPGRAFADALVLACAADPRLVRAGVAKARAVHPDAFDAVVSALALGSSPNVASLSAELCLEDDEASVRAGLEVMRRRRAVSVPLATTALYHPARAVRVAAALALGFARPAEAAIGALEGRLAVEPDLGAQAAIVEALVRLCAPHAESYVARLFGELLGQAPRGATEREARLALAQLAAIVGRVDELGRFCEVATEPLELECVGWFGRVLAVDPLVRVLERAGEDDAPVARAAARALQRILGLVPTSGARGVELGRAELVTVDDERLVVTPAPWRRAWATLGTELPVSVRFRFGLRHDAEASRREHLASGVRARDRRLTSLELAWSSGGRLAPADEDDWVARQVAALGAP